MTREHVNRSDCWCLPRLQLPCVICEHGCTACDGGWRDVDRETFDDAEVPGVVIHRDVDKP